MTIAKAIARAWTDETYRSRLLTDPRSALGESGVQVPDDTEVKVVEDTPGVTHIVLPSPPDDVSSMSEAELEQVAAAGISIIVTNQRGGTNFGVYQEPPTYPSGG